MRVVGVDLGASRIGVAVSDASGTVASPHIVLRRARDRASDHAALRAVVEEIEAERVVVGLPLSLDGTMGPAALAVDEEVRELAAALPVPVETVDERLTTVTAERSLRAGGVRGRRRREVVDKVAAAVLLQAWLDARASRP